MLSQVTCEACGTEWADTDVSCRACGFANPPLAAAEELIASWVVTSAPAEPPSAARDPVCVACGYEGPLVPSPDGDRGLCPACGDPWQDRGGVIRKFVCSDCGQVLLLTEQHRGNTVICPGCRSLLGCLIGLKGRRWGGRFTIFDITTLSAAFAPRLHGGTGDLGATCPLADPLRHLGDRVADHLDAGSPEAHRPAPSRRRRFDPPGLAACLAVSAASLVNSWWAWDIAVISPSVPYNVFSVAALRVVEPLPLAAAVAGIWSVLIFDRRWRPEPSWIDRAGRCLGIYWLAAGLVVPLLHLFLS